MSITKSVTINQAAECSRGGEETPQKARVRRLSRTLRRGGPCDWSGSGYDVSAGASRGSAQPGGEAEAGGLRIRADSPESRLARTLCLSQKGPMSTQRRSRVGQLVATFKWRTFLPRVRFAYGRGKRCCGDARRLLFGPLVMPRPCDAHAGLCTGCMLSLTFRHSLFVFR